MNERDVPTQTSPPADDQPAAPAASSLYEDDLVCPDCGYSLRGLTSERCPECGLDLSFIMGEASLIAWERRAEIGRFRAYWATVWAVIRRPKLFCRALYRPIDYAAAQRFRWICVVVCFLALLALQLVMSLLPLKMLEEASKDISERYIILDLACLFAALLAFTGLPSYFFHPRTLSIERQNRAIAISCYASAPLTLALLAPLVAFVCLWFWHDSDYDHVAMTIIIVFGVIIFGLCFTPLNPFTKRALAACGWRRTTAVWIMPALQVVASGVILIVPPLIFPFFLQIFRAYWAARHLG